MSLCVVAYPEVEAADWGWIQAIRRASDPQFNLIDPHFTLIFPTDAVDARTLEAHVRSSVAGSSQFRFVLRCALPVKDSFSAQTHLFLVPDEGLSQLVRLHSRLYTGLLKTQLRLDIPYLPHITVGAFVDAGECKAAADSLKQRSFGVDGRISRLSLLQVTQTSVTTLTDIDLA
jgi:2'-5' RNA ligase